MIINTVHDDSVLHCRLPRCHVSITPMPTDGGSSTHPTVLALLPAVCCTHCHHQLRPPINDRDKKSITQTIMTGSLTTKCNYWQCPVKMFCEECLNKLETLTGKRVRHQHLQHVTCKLEMCMESHGSHRIPMEMGIRSAMEMGMGWELRAWEWECGRESGKKIPIEIQSWTEVGSNFSDSRMSWRSTWTSRSAKTQILFSFGWIISRSYQSCTQWLSKSYVCQHLQLPVKECSVLLVAW